MSTRGTQYSDQTTTREHHGGGENTEISHDFVYYSLR